MPAASPAFKNILQRMDFNFSNKEEFNLLLTNGDKQKPKATPKELFILEQASKHEASAVYFRKFSDGRESQPQIFLYDCTKNKLKSTSIASIHRNLWSSCIIPLFIVIEDSNVQIYDCRKPVTVNGEDITTNPIETLQLSDAALKQYSAKLFDNGTFWEQDYNKNRYLADTSAYQTLIKGLKNIRTQFIKESKLDKSVVHKLLVRCILIKYLEERGNGQNKKFAEEFFQKKFGHANFFELLSTKGKVLEVFDALSEHFNGKIFEWVDASERNILKKANLQSLAAYLDGRNFNNQLVIWAEYSFKHLPVELISSIYEAFLKSKDDTDVVYTPEHLVNLMVDECMDPKDFSGKEAFKVIDGTCGSGIFLVKAFKRMVQWKRYEAYQNKAELCSPSIKTLLNILQNNIYGVEEKGDAAQLTVFSLAVALCDELSPKQIWHELKFVDLSKKNIIKGDFFDFLQTVKLSTFDLVIGNPPFDEPNTPDFNKLVSKSPVPLPVKIPQNQFALLYLNQAMLLLKPNAMLALVMPSGALLYNNTLDFRSYFFSKYNVEQIVDFTNLSAILFQGQANVAAAALFVRNNIKKLNEDIVHITVNRTKAAKDRIYFEIDHYDYHYVPNNIACKNPYVWKANLLGGGRVLDLINRFSNYQTIKDYLKTKKKDGWVHGEGYIVGHDGTASEKDLIKRKFKKAEYLTNKTLLVTEKFGENGFEPNAFREETNTYFYRKSNPKLFEPPFVVIKEVFGDQRLSTYFSEKPFIYKHQIMGISAPVREKEGLKSLKKYLDEFNSLTRFFIAIKSNHFLVSWSSAISKNSIIAVPFLKDEKIKMSISDNIIVDDVLKHRINFLQNGEKSPLNTGAHSSELKEYSKTLCKVLNSIYGDKQKKFRFSKIIDAPAFYACEYELSKREINSPIYDNSVKAENNLQSLLKNEHSGNVNIIRVVKLFQNNKIYLIKPKALRYWLKSIALRDADEIFDQILES